VLGCPWQRCTVHFLREALGHARREQQPMLAALLRPLFNADDREQARELAGEALRRLEKPLPKVAALLEEAEEDLLAFYCFPAEHWPKLRSTNPLERVNREIGRRTDVVGIFPNDRALLRLAASVVIEQNDEWLVGAATSATTRWKQSSIQKQPKTKTERSTTSSPRPEQPTMPASYTTSRDLTVSSARMRRSPTSCSGFVRR
jgi:transposase-like protein